MAPIDFPAFGDVAREKDRGDHMGDDSDDAQRGEHQMQPPPQPFGQADLPGGGPWA